MTLDQAAARLGELSGKPTRTFATRDFGRAPYPDARSVVVAADDAFGIVYQVRAALGPGLVAFIGCTRSLAAGAEEGSEVVVAPGNSQFDILRVAQSEALNQDMGTEVLVRKLEEYDRKYGIDIFRAETDTISFRLKTLPTDLSGFCHDLYKLCPDVVDQGVGSIEELQKEVAQHATVLLWWD